MVEVDKLCKNKTATLRSWLQNQSNKFLNKFHTDRKDKLTLAIESETWKITDLSSDFQTLLDNIIKNYFNNIPSNLTFTINSNVLYLNDEKYLFFGIVIVLFKLLIEYIQLENDIPGSTYDVMTRLIELFTVIQFFFLFFCYPTRT